MNLALISDHCNDVGKSAIEVLISNSLEQTDSMSVVYFASEPDPEHIFFDQTKSIYESLGVKIIHYVEIEENYDEVLIEECLSASIIHLSGGDTYRFLFWLKKRGVDKLIANQVKAGKPIVGISAGAMILTPSIDTAHLCGDENNVGLENTTAMGLVPFLFCPHASHSEKEKEIVSNLRFDSQIAMCKDSDAIVVIGSKITQIGGPFWIQGA